MHRVQEVTDSIFALLSSAPWMKQYEACPAGGQAYYTALLYRRDAVSGAQPACLHRFPGSCMGGRLMHPRLPLTLLLCFLDMGCVLLRATMKARQMVSPDRVV